MSPSGPSPAVPTAARSAFRALVGRHVGVVRRVVEAVRSESDPPMFAFAAELCDAAALGRGACLPNAAGGGWTREEALLRCLGEAAERYGASTPAGFARVVGPPPAGAVLPGDVAPFSDEQRRGPGFPFASEGPCAWVEGIDLATGRPRSAPAFAVYIPYAPAAGEAVFGPSLSTGLAAGPTVDSALDSALLEAIERDAFVRWWFAGEPAPTVDLAGAHAVDLTGRLGVPVAAVLVERDVVSVGTAAARTFDEALGKAHLEAELGQIYVRSLVRRSTPRDRLESFEDHARFYTDHAERRAVLDLFRTGPRRAPTACRVDPREALLAAGYAPWWKDLTSSDLACAGFHVVKAIVPGLAPLHAIEDWPFLGAPGLVVRNRSPHPIP
ncbi:MAG: YcaO-like family protein [Planctomycetota bacterium]